MEPFRDKLKRLLQERGISANQFERETGIARRIFCESYTRKLHRSTLLAIAYFLQMDVEELVQGTTAEESWYS